ncbi:MAG TPA: ectoine/hydroxyectoine ABC transporter substrate-binding protein EhuB [Bauldia sp.]|nr:ectoine/hydroxyectoine ABC transporter substrate-binding protein EhuB [Bauldia sp.]
MSLISIRNGLIAFAVVALVAGHAKALTLDEARESGVRIGFQNEPPYAYVGDNGKIMGTDNVLVMSILEKMGITKVDAVVMDFASLIPGLQANRLDIIPSVFILPKRCALVSFSNPIWRGGTAFAVLAGNPKNLHSFDDVVKAGATVGVMSGAIENDYAKKAGIPDDKIMPLADAAALLEALKSGRVDAVILTPDSVKAMAERSDGTVERADPFENPPFANAYAASVFRKEDNELREAFNAELKNVVGTPEFMEMLKPNGYTEDNLPGDMTAEARCAMPE